MQPRLTLSCGEYKRTRPLLDGRVAVAGYDIEIIPDPFPPTGILGDYQYPRTLRMLDDKAFDICEMGMAPFVTARSQGVPLVAIPVFHYRRFRHPYIFCRGPAGIESPGDLAGRRVGVRRLNLSAGLWARALLQHDYGVNLNDITWVVTVDVPLRDEVRNSLNVDVVRSGESLEELLVRGDIDAMIEASTVSATAREAAGVRRLLGEDTRQLEVDYYSRTGCFPIMHTIALWQDVAERHEDLCQVLYEAFSSRQDGRAPRRRAALPVHSGFRGGGVVGVACPGTDGHPVRRPRPSERPMELLPRGGRPDRGGVPRLRLRTGPHPGALPDRRPVHRAWEIEFDVIPAPSVVPPKQAVSKP